MSLFTWTGIAAANASNVATRRLVEEGSTLLGATFPTDVTREAVLAELVKVANQYSESVARLNEIRRFSLYQGFTSPVFAIDTNFDVKNTEVVPYTNGGTLKSLADNTSFNTGTAKTITASLFGAAVLSVNASGTGVVTWATGAGYASEALAIAALTDPAATDTILGYFSVQAHASGFTAGTDALTTGTGGNVATATTYYNVIPPVLLPGAAVS